MSWIYKYTELHMSTYYYFSSWPQKRASWEILIFTPTLKLDLSGFSMLCLWRQQPAAPLTLSSAASLHHFFRSPGLRLQRNTLPSLVPSNPPLPTQPPPPLRAGLQWSLQLATAFPPLSERRSRGAGLWIQVKEKQADQGQKKKKNGWGGESNVWSSLWTHATPQISPPQHQPHNHHVSTSLLLFVLSFFPLLGVFLPFFFFFWCPKEPRWSRHSLMLPQPSTPPKRTIIRCKTFVWPSF